MSNSLEKAEQAMKRRDVFDRLAKKANESMTPVLSEAIDEIVNLDAEVAELTKQRDQSANAVLALQSGQPFNAVVIADTVKLRTAYLEQECDQLRNQVTLLRDVLYGASQIITFEGVPYYLLDTYERDEALTATEPKP